jgi:hypothetical protein
MRPHPSLYCQTCSRAQSSRLLPFVCSPKRLSFESSFTRTLHDSRFCRDLFCRHGGHGILDLLRLCCRYLCLNTSLIGGGEGMGVLRDPPPSPPSPPRVRMVSVGRCLSSTPTPFSSPFFLWLCLFVLSALVREQLALPLPS